MWCSSCEVLKIIFGCGFFLGGLYVSIGKIGRRVFRKFIVVVI